MFNVLRRTISKDRPVSIWQLSKIMKAPIHSFSVRLRQGLEVRLVSNEHIELAMVLGPGATIVSCIGLSQVYAEISSVKKADSRKSLL
jgi:hypothetical protein